MGHFVARVQRVQRVRPAFGRLVQRVAVSPYRAMNIKSALRDWLSASYGMVSTLRIGSLRSPPPIRLRHWTHLRCEGSQGSEGSKGSEGGGGG